MPLPGASLAELVGGGPGDAGQLTKPLWVVAPTPLLDAQPGGARESTGTGDPYPGHTDSVSAVAVGELDGRPIVVSGGPAVRTAPVWSLGTGGNPRVIRLDVGVTSGDEA